MLQTVVLEKTFESHLDCKELQPANPKGNQCWIFIERTDTEAEAPIVWPLDVKSWLIRKESEEEKGTTEDKMVGGASPNQWTWVWASSGRWGRTGKPGMLQSMGLQRVRHDWATEQMRSKEPGIWSTNQYALVGGSSPELLGYLPIWCLSPTSSSPIGEAKLVLDLLSVCA